MYVSNERTCFYNNNVYNTNTSKPSPTQAFQASNSNSGGGIIYACGNMSGNGIWVKYDENSTEDNPIMSVKVVSKGKASEVKINPREINPAKASAAEMAALIAYSNAKGDKQSLNPAMVRVINETDDLFQKKDMEGIIKSYADNSMNRKSYEDLLNVIDTFLSYNAGKSKNNDVKKYNAANYGIGAEQFLIARNAYNNRIS